MADATQALRICGACDKWRETKTQCPGMGYCEHELARSTKQGPDRLSVATRFIGIKQACLLGLK